MERLSSLLPTKRTAEDAGAATGLFLDAVIYRPTGVPARPPRAVRPVEVWFTIGLPTGLDEGCGCAFLSRWLDVDDEGSIVDASIVRAHQDAAGGKNQTNCLGRCRGGFSTKIHVVMDLRGRPLFVTLTPGQRHETTVAQQLIEHAQGRAFLADTAYDSSELIQQLDERGMQVVICQHPRRKTGRRPLPRELYPQALSSSYSSITPNASAHSPPATKRPPVTTSRCSTSPAPSSGSIRGRPL